MTWTIKNYILDQEQNTSTIAIAMLQHSDTTLTPTVKLIRTKAGATFCTVPSIRFNDEYHPAYQHPLLTREALQLIQAELTALIAKQDPHDQKNDYEQGLPF